MSRVYFSVYQKGLGEEGLFAERQGEIESGEVFKREHRLYQTDFLLRKYGFKREDIIFDERGRLSLSADPKEVWAKNHPEFFPVKVNFASKWALLRVPGLGPITVNRILGRRKQGKFSSIKDLGKSTVRLRKAGGYLVF